MQRQGQSALEAVAQITAAIYPSLSGSGQNQKSVADQYGIKIKGLTLKLEDGADNEADDQDGKRDAVLAVQKRLDDLNFGPWMKLPAITAKRPRLSSRNSRTQTGLQTPPVPATRKR